MSGWMKVIAGLVNTFSSSEVSLVVIGDDILQTISQLLGQWPKQIIFTVDSNFIQGFLLFVSLIPCLQSTNIMMKACL